MPVHMPYARDLPATTQDEREESPIPPLKHGDHLSLPEFERRYHALPQVKKAELLEGVVSVPSPLRFESHSEPHGHVLCWVGTYSAQTPGVRFGDAPTVRLDTERNEVQPDVLLRLAPSAGGSSTLSDDDYIEGAPEWIGEIAASSADYDIRQKRRLYQQAGVQEYLVWRVQETQLDWWHLVDGIYQPLPADEQGIIASRVFPGLRLNVMALLAGNLAAVLATLQQHLGDGEHQAFVQRLQRSA